MATPAASVVQSAMRATGREQGRVAPPAQVPGRDAEHEHRGGERGRGDRVAERADEGRVGEDLEDRRHLRAMRDRVELVADGVLHPRVRGEDEVRGRGRADRHEPEHPEVHLRLQVLPAEDPQAEERRLDEERRQALDRERRAEDVADVARVRRPVHAELELLHDAGDDAEREVDEEELPEEARQPQPPLVARAVPRRLHPDEEPDEPDRQRDEEEVVERRDSKLPTREVERVHVREAANPSAG